MAVTSTAMTLKRPLASSALCSAAGSWPCPLLRRRPLRPARPSPRSSARRSAPAAMRRRPKPGAARTTTSPWPRPPKRRCSATSKAPPSPTATSPAASFAATAGSSSTPTAPDGRLADFEIAFVFGVYPLQQYLIAFPDGRMQALGIAWDARAKDAGGQRWFHLYPGQELEAGHPLHWTGIDQTWNFQCAECHSTELRKNYDAAKNTYATTWAEIDVACEACHGPGSAHTAWAKGGRQGPNGLTVAFDERKGVHWVLDEATGTARRSTPRASAKELETCGMCHSRSAKIAEPWRPGRPLLDTHIPSLLQPGLFEADGKSLDEVYNYAPFRQSRMFKAGVSCSDCHDPHSLKLVAEGDGVCLQCHAGERFAAAAHHHHPEDSAGARCVACHMPTKTYMIVDPRHDHAFRIPRPDELVRFGTSNACTDCHADQDAAWAAAAVERWYGPSRKGLQTWTEAFAAHASGKPEAGALLLALAKDATAPAIARATAYENLGAYPGRNAVASAERDLRAADPLLRLGALRSLRPYPPATLWPLVSPLLEDPVLAVRIEAATLLADAPAERLRPEDAGPARPRSRRVRRGAEGERRPAGASGEPRHALPAPAKVRRGRSGTRRGPSARSGVRAGGGGLGGSLRPAGPRRARRGGAPRRAGAPVRKRRAAPRPRPEPGSPAPPRRRAGRTGARRRSRPRQPALRLRLCRGAGFVGPHRRGHRGAGGGPRPPSGRPRHAARPGDPQPRCRPRRGRPDLGRAARRRRSGGPAAPRPAPALSGRPFAGGSGERWAGEPRAGRGHLPARRRQRTAGSRRARKSLISWAISAPWVSRAKWPVSSMWISASGRSRL